MSKYIIIIFIFLSIGKACCAEVMESLNRSIKDSDKISFVKCDLMMQGSIIYKFKNQNNQLIMVMISYKREGMSRVFDGLKFSGDEVLENYLPKESIGRNFGKLKKMISAIDQDTIDSKTEKRRFQLLIEKFNGYKDL